MAGVDFGKQYGPLPLGAWVVVVGGGLGIAFYTRRTSAKTPLVVTDTSGDPGVGLGGIPGGFLPINPPSDSGGTTPATNEEWGRAAINYLIAQGYDPNVADAAVRKYLEAAQLGLQEYALIRFALIKLGSPPVPLPPPPAAPTIPPVVTPAQPPPVTPTQPGPPSEQLRYVMVRPWPSKLSTLSGIAYAYYGREDAWRDIYNANRKGYTRPDGSPGFISNPNYLRPGDVLWVPGLGGPIR